MAKKTVLVVTGTRAEYGMLRSTMDAIRAHPALDLKVLVTGMHTLQMYGDTEQEIARDYTIDHTVPISEEDDMLSALSREIGGIREYCVANRPHCILVLGDRDEPFAAAIVAAHLYIPLAHIHGGDITGPGVDEHIRHAITKFAHIHFPGTKKAAERIRALAEDPSRIFYVGTPVIDMLAQDTFLDRQRISSELSLDASKQWLTVVAHPSSFEETPIAEQIGSIVAALAGFPDYEKIVLYPNSDTGTDVFIHAIQKLSGLRYHVFTSLPRLTYISVVKESAALIGNSSAGIIETAFLGTPSVNIGRRQEGRERGPSVIDVPFDPVQIESEIRHAEEMKASNRGRSFPSPYGDPGAGARIAETLARELERPDILEKRFFA